jgi:hypothetical protein
MDPYNAALGELSTIIQSIPLIALEDDPLRKDKSKGYMEMILKSLPLVGITEHQYLFGRALSTSILHFLSSVPLEYLAREGPIREILMDNDLIFILTRYSNITITDDPLTRTNVVVRDQDYQLSASDGVINLPEMPNVPINSISISGVTFCLVISNAIRTAPIQATLRASDLQLFSPNGSLPVASQMLQRAPKKIIKEFGDRLPQNGVMFLPFPTQLHIEPPTTGNIVVRIQFYDVLTEVLGDNGIVLRQYTLAAQS